MLKLMTQFLIGTYPRSCEKTGAGGVDADARAGSSPLSRGIRPPDALHGIIPYRGTPRPGSHRALAGPHKRITPPTSACHGDTSGTILKQWGHVE